MADLQLQMVTFQIGEEKYGVDIMDVKEIYGLSEVRQIPNAPSYVEGIFNLRGDITPVINLHKRFQIKKAVMSEEEALLSGFIIININDMQLGIIIDKILRVVTVEPSTIQPPPQMVSGIGAEYIQGVVNDGEGYLIILNIRRLFDPKELQQLSTMRR